MCNIIFMQIAQGLVMTWQKQDLSIIKLHIKYSIVDKRKSSYISAMQEWFVALDKFIVLGIEVCLFGSIKEDEKFSLKIYKMCHTHTMEYYSAFKRKRFLTHDTTQTSLEDIMLCEISQSQKGKCYMISLTKYLKQSNS